MADKKPRGRKAVARPTVADCERDAPPVDGIGDLGEALLLAAFNGVTELDMTEILKSQVGKAKGGDTRAAKFVTDFALGAVRAQPAGPDPPPAAVPPAVLRNLSARVLAMEGPLPLNVLAAHGGVGVAELEAALAGCDWFELPPLGAVNLTPAGRAKAGL